MFMHPKKKWEQYYKRVTVNEKEYEERIRISLPVIV